MVFKGEGIGVQKSRYWCLKDEGIGVQKLGCIIFESYSFFDHLFSAFLPLWTSDYISFVFQRKIES